MEPHTLSELSLMVYRTLHPDLQKLIDWALNHVLVDFSLIEGHRSPATQFEYYKEGRQQLPGGEWVIVKKKKVITNSDGYEKKGKHNYLPSLAVDFCAFVPGKPYLAYDPVQLSYIAGAIISKAEELYAEGIIEHRVRWGNDWDMDGDFSDNNLVDMPHIELYKD